MCWCRVRRRWNSAWLTHQSNLLEWLLLGIECGPELSRRVDRGIYWILVSKFVERCTTNWHRSIWKTWKGMISLTWHLEYIGRLTMTQRNNRRPPFLSKADTHEWLSDYYYFVSFVFVAWVTIATSLKLTHYFLRHALIPWRMHYR